MANNTDYTEPRTDILNLLPTTLKTEVNQAFLDNVVNRYLTKTELTPVHGSIGKKPTNIKTVRRIPEASVHRQAYQLQPLLYKNIATRDHVASYQDILTKAERLGIDIDRLPIWGDTQQFNFIPPVDLDKLVNWSQYFWFNPNNSIEQPQYITIKSQTTVHTARANEKQINLKNIISDGQLSTETKEEFDARVALATAEVLVLNIISYILNGELPGIGGVIYYGIAGPNPTPSNNLWYDTINKQLKLYNGTTWDILDDQFPVIGGVIYFGMVAPTTVPINKLWYDTINNQLNFYDGVDWIIPSFSNIFDGLLDLSTYSLIVPVQNDWAKENKWVHQNEVTDITIAHRAVMPIIEYNPHLELNGWTYTKHVWAYRGAADQDWREIDRSPTIYEMGIRFEAVVGVGGLMTLHGNHTNVYMTGTTMTLYTTVYSATGQTVDVLGSTYDLLTDTTTVNTEISPFYYNKTVFVAPVLTTTSVSTHDTWVNFHKHWALIDVIHPVPVNSQIELDAVDAVGEDIDVVVSRREFVFPGGTKFIEGSDTIRVYVDGVRQYGTYVENGHSGIHTSHIYFNEPVAAGSNVVIELSTAAKSDKYLMGSVPGDGILVRNSTESDFDAGYTTVLTSLVEYRKNEQIKTQHTQYPLFDIFDVFGNTVHSVSSIFAFEEDPTFPVNNRVNRRIKVTDQGKEYYFDQLLLNEDNGELFCYKDQWSVSSLNPTGLQTIWRTSDTTTYTPQRVNEFRLADGDTYIDSDNKIATAVVSTEDSDWEIPDQMMFNPHHENRKKLKYTELVTHIRTIVDAQHIPEGFEFMNSNYYKLLITPNYGVGGTIKEHNGGYDTFLSSLFQTMGSPRTVISFAQQQYEHNLLLVKEYFIRDAVELMTPWIGDVNSNAARIADAVITRIEQNDLLDNTFGDSTTYNKSTGTGIINWIATMPYIGMTVPTKPELLDDGVSIRNRVLHHDGHMSIVSIPESIKQSIYDQLTIQHVDLDWVLAKIILEIETRLYQAVPDFKKLSFDITTLLTTTEDQEVFVGYMKDQYFEYLMAHNIDPYATNFNITDAFTWNYQNVDFTGSVRTDNRPVTWGSSWEAIYQSNFGTEYPHLMPWKLQGYNDRPEWWNANYADPVSGQWIPNMWDNIMQGRGITGKALPDGTIATGAIQLVGYRFVCVDTVTNHLLPPYFASTQSNQTTFFNDWSYISGATSTLDDPYMFGQDGPVELTWKATTDFLYGLAHIAFRMQPVRFMHHVFGTEYVDVAGLQVDVNSHRVLSHQNTRFHGDVVDDQLVQFNGLNQWYVNYIRYHNIDTNVSDFRDMWMGWTSRLSYQTGSFINTKSLDLVSKNFSVIEQDYDIIIKKTPDMQDYWINALLVTADTVGSDWRISGTAKVPRLYGEDWTFRLTIPSPTNPKIKYYGLKQYPCAFDHVTDIGQISGTLDLPWAIQLTNYVYGEDLNYVLDDTLTWFTGSPVQVRALKTYPAPLTPNTTYYIIKVSGQSFKLASSYNNAVLGIHIDIETSPDTNDLVYIEEVFGTFVATNGSVTGNTWKHYGIDKRVVLEAYTPTVYTGVQTLIDVIDGYVAYNESQGWIFNDSTATEVDLETGQLVSWQTETERLINKIYTGLGSITHINLTDLPVRLTDSSTYTSANQFPLSLSGIPPVINGVMLTSGDRVYFPNVTERTDVGIWTWYNNSTSLQWIQSENVDLDTTTAYHEINPFRNNIWFKHDQGIITNVHTGPYTDVRVNTTLYDQSGTPLQPSTVYVFRSDKLSRIRTCSLCGSSYAQSGAISSIDNDIIRTYTDPHLGGAHIFLDGYEHTIMFNNYTTENYLIFDPFLGLSTGKFSLNFEKNRNYTLRPNIGGFFLSGTEMVQNIENTVDNIRNYYDTYQVNETADFLDYARAVLGYTPPEYLDYISIGPKSKFVFWKGMIQNKGATSAIRAFINARMFVDARVDEFWAYKVAEFGNVGSRKFNDVWVQPSDVMKGDLRLNFVPSGGVNESRFTNIYPSDQTRWVNFPDQRSAIDQINNFYFNVDVSQELSGNFIFRDGYVYMIIEPSEQIIITSAAVYGWDIGSFDGTHLDILSDVTVLVEGTDYVRINNKIIQFPGTIDTSSIKVRSLTLSKHKYNPAKLVDQKTGAVVSSLMIWHPAFGHHYHIPMNRIEMQLPDDPAKYNVVVDESDINGYDPLTAWNMTEIGKTWLDSKSVDYIPYYDASIFPNIIDRLRYWGSPAEWSTFGLYEWVESPVSPADWVTYTETAASDPNIDHYSKPSGTPIRVLYKNITGVDESVSFTTNPIQRFDVLVNGTANSIYQLDRNWGYYSESVWSSIKNTSQVHPVIQSTRLDTNIGNQQPLNVYVNGIYNGIVNTVSVISTDLTEEPTYKADGDIYQVPTNATGEWERFAGDVSYLHYPIAKTINRLVRWDEALGIWDRVPGDIRCARPNPHPFPTDQDTHMVTAGSWDPNIFGIGDYAEWYETAPARWEAVLTDYTKFSMTVTVLPLVPNPDIAYRVGNIVIKTSDGAWTQARGIPPQLVNPAISVGRGDTYEVGSLETLSIVPTSVNGYPTYHVGSRTPVLAKIPPSLSELDSVSHENTGDVFIVEPIQRLLTPPTNPEVGDVYKPIGVCAGTSRSTMERDIPVFTEATLWMWGSNAAGQLGDGTFIHRSSPVQVGSLTNWADISSGHDHSLAIKTNGTLWSWGNNNNGQLGNGITLGNGMNWSALEPAQIGSSQDWAAVAGGGMHSLAIKTNGTLWGWGDSSIGQLGLGDVMGSTVPVQIGSLTTWKMVDCGLFHTTAINSEGMLWSWGNGSNGQLGLGDTMSRSYPTQVGSFLNNWSTVACGDSFTVATKTDGSLWAWGWNEHSQLGLGDTTQRMAPEQVGLSNSWSTVACGRHHTVATKTDGTLWAWGYNIVGQLGDGELTTKSVPVQVGAHSHWDAVACGHYHTVAIADYGGTLWAWGWNANGELGDETRTTMSLPTQIGSLMNWVDVSCGVYHTTALRSVASDGGTDDGGTDAECMGVIPLIDDVIPKSPDTGSLYRVPEKTIETVSVVPTVSDGLEIGAVYRIGTKDITAVDALPSNPDLGDTHLVNQLDIGTIPEANIFRPDSGPGRVADIQLYDLPPVDPVDPELDMHGNIISCTYYLVGDGGFWAEHAGNVAKYVSGRWIFTDVEKLVPHSEPLDIVDGVIDNKFYLVGEPPVVEEEVDPDAEPPLPGEWDGKVGQLVERVGGAWVFTDLNVLPVTDVPPPYATEGMICLVGSGGVWTENTGKLAYWNVGAWTFISNPVSQFKAGDIVEYDMVLGAWVEWVDELEYLRGKTVQYNGEEWIVVPEAWLSNTGHTVQWDGVAWNTVPTAWESFEGQIVEWNGSDWDRLPDAWVVPGIVQWDGTTWAPLINPWDDVEHLSTGDMVQWDGTSWNKVPDAWKSFSGQIVQWDGADWFEMPNNPWEDLLPGQVVQWNGTEWIELIEEWQTPGNLMGWNGSEWVTVPNTEVIHLGLSGTDGNQRAGDVFWFNHTLTTGIDSYNYTTNVSAIVPIGNIVIVEDNMTLRTVVSNVGIRNTPPIPDKSPFAYISNTPEFTNGTTYFVVSGEDGTEWGGISSKFTQYIAAAGNWVRLDWDAQTAKYTYDALTTTGAYVDIDQLTTYKRRDQDNITFVHDLLSTNSQVTSTAAIQYEIDTPYTKIDKYDAMQNISSSKYYFWTEQGNTKPAPTIPSIIEVRNMLRQPNVPYMFAQGYVPSDITTGAPERYTQAIVRGISNMVSEQDRYKVRLQTVTSLRDAKDIKNTLTTKNIHTEWELFRQHQPTVISKSLWDRLTESVVGHKIGDVSVPVPSTERLLYDQIHGTTTRLGMGDGQSFVDRDLAISSIVAEIESPDYDLYPVDKSGFLDVHKFDTAENILSTMNYIYDNFAHTDTNRIFFSCLNDALSQKSDYGDIMKTSTISLYGIRVIETADRLVDD